MTAESCTGGWIAKALTDIAGSSEWFTEGVVSYSNESKVRRLGVPRSILDEDGAVSEATVRAMAIGALRHSAAPARGGGHGHRRARRRGSGQTGGNRLDRMGYAARPQRTR